MDHFNFDDAGLEPEGGSGPHSRVVRRWLYRLIRPALPRQADLLRKVCDRLDDEEWGTVSLQRQVEYVDGRVDTLSDRLQTTVALGWDYVATVRRLAVLEDRVESLMEARERAEGSAETSSFPFANPETPGLSPTGTMAP